MISQQTVKVISNDITAEGTSLIYLVIDKSRQYESDI